MQDCKGRLQGACKAMHTRSILPGRPLFMVQAWAGRTHARKILLYASKAKAKARPQGKGQATQKATRARPQDAHQESRLVVVSIMRDAHSIGFLRFFF